MRRTALVVAAGLFWPASTFSQDRQVIVSMNGNQLYAYCTSAPGSPQAMACLGYENGVTDTLQSAADVIRRANHICLPQNVSGQQVLDVVRDYFRDHPEDRHHVASDEVILALRTAFPCKK